MRKQRRAKRLEQTIRRTIFFTVLSLLIALSCRALAIQDIRQLNTVKHTVSQGDTLWSIAEQYKPNNVRYDDYIYAIKERNGISSLIQAGQEIEVLVKSDIK